MSAGRNARKLRARRIPDFRKPPTATEESDPIKRFAGMFRYPKGYLKRLRREWRA